MAFSHDVQFWKLARLAKATGRKRVHGVRWVVAGKPLSKWFEYEAQADSYRSKLIRAARAGEGFDTGTGLPESAAREQQAVTWFDPACRYVDLKWPHAAAKSRTSIADALGTVTPVLVTTSRGKPDPTRLRAVLYGWAFHRTHRETIRLHGDDAAALAWVRDYSLKVTALDAHVQGCFGDDHLRSRSRTQAIRHQILPAGLVPTFMNHGPRDEPLQDCSGCPDGADQADVSPRSTSRRSVR
jgi:hypothetical protein